MTDYATFVSDVAALILAELPLQSLDSATSLTYAYISDVGGWVPTVQQDPFGDGQPANGFSEQDTADAITQNQINAVYDIDFTVTVTLNVQAIAQLTDSISLDTAAASMAGQVTSFITDTINSSPIPLQVTAVGAQTPVSGNSLTGGYTTQSIRNHIQSEIAASPATKNVDYKATALSYVRNIYGVDDTWNVWMVYTQPDDPIAVMIKKYTSTSYATLDNSSTTVYLISISPVSYLVIAGVIID